MNTDNFVNKIGGCGPFQAIIYLGVYPGRMVITGILQMMVFGSYNPGWTCTQESDISSQEFSDNLTTHHRQITSLFTSKTNGTLEKEGDCEIRSNCSRIEFSSDSSTFVTEWGLICDLAWVKSVMLSIDMAGLGMGATACGPIGDRFGRKITYLFFMMWCLLFNVLILFVNSWQLLAVCRFFASLGNGALISIIAIYLIEFSPAKWRVMMMCIPSWNINLLIFSLIVLFVRDWRIMQMGLVATIAVGIIAGFWLPESLRWLTVRGELEKARGVALRYCKWNRRRVESESQLNFKGSEGSDSEKKISLLPLFQKILLKKTLLVSLILMLVSMTYYGLYFGVNNLHGNFYINLILFSVPTIPLSPLTPIVSNYLGRRGSNLIMFGTCAAISGLIVLVYFVLGQDGAGGWTITALALFTSTVLGQTWYVHWAMTSELFPTSLRASIFALIQVSARVGGVIAPYILPRSKEDIYVYYIINAVLLSLCFCMLLALPETKKTPMTDTLAQLKQRHAHSAQGGEETEPL